MENITFSSSPSLCSNEQLIQGLSTVGGALFAYLILKQGTGWAHEGLGFPVTVTTLAIGGCAGWLLAKALFIPKQGGIQEEINRRRYGPEGEIWQATSSSGSESAEHLVEKNSGICSAQGTNHKFYPVEEDESNDAFPLVRSSSEDDSFNTDSSDEGFSSSEDCSFKIEQQVEELTQLEEEKMEGFSEFQTREESDGGSSCSISNLEEEPSQLPVGRRSSIDLGSLPTLVQNTDKKENKQTSLSAPVSPSTSLRLQKPASLSSEESSASSGALYSSEEEDSEIEYQEALCTELGVSSNPETNELLPLPPVRARTPSNKRQENNKPQDTDLIKNLQKRRRVSHHEDDELKTHNISTLPLVEQLLLVKLKPTAPAQLEEKKVREEEKKKQPDPTFTATHKAARKRYQEMNQEGELPDQEEFRGTESTLGNTWDPNVLENSALDFSEVIGINKE